MLEGNVLEQMLGVCVVAQSASACDYGHARTMNAEIALTSLGYIHLHYSTSMHCSTSVVSMHRNYIAEGNCTFC